MVQQVIQSDVLFHRKHYCIFSFRGKEDSMLESNYSQASFADANSRVSSAQTDLNAIKR